MWNMTKYNRNHQRFLRLKEDMRLKAKLKQIKAKVEVSPPPQHRHVSANYKGRLAEIDRKLQIDRENQQLVSRIFESPSTPTKIVPVKKLRQRSFLALNRQRLLDIQSENYKLHSRLMSSKSEYNIKNYQSKSQFELYLKENISRNAGRVDLKEKVPTDVAYVLKVLKKASSLRNVYRRQVSDL